MPVETEHLGQTLVIRIDREHRRNAIDSTTARGIDAALRELDENPALAVGIITGTSSVFSAGTDFNDVPNAWTPDGGEYGLIRRKRTKPLIAAVEGAALGGGFEIVLACDVVTAAENATFGLPEVLRGVVASSGGLFRGPRALPQNIVARMLLTGEPITAAEAYRIGFVNELTDPGDAVDAAAAIAIKIQQAAPLAVQQTVQVLAGLSESEEDLGWHLTAEAVQIICASQDYHEGISAFFDRRAPQWSGR
jgi:enoyl-CoA hydratase